MTFNYPNGKRFIPKNTNNTCNSSNTNGSTKVKKAVNTYSGRGQTLEQDIDETNEYYLLKGLAVIHKKPTPIQIVKVDYPKRSAATIREACFKTPSTTDYKGIYIDFEAKETKNKHHFL